MEQGAARDWKVRSCRFLSLRGSGKSFGESLEDLSLGSFES